MEGGDRDRFLPQLLRHIQHQGKITFAEYMAWVLYHPEGGYYSSHNGLGPQGDFVTSVHLCADFGELLAVQFAQMWQILGCPEPFSIVEMGAGQGILAADVLRSLAQSFPDCCAATCYSIIETSPRLRHYQCQHFQTLNLAQQPQWLGWDDLPPGIEGCFFSNELVDALPVHLVEVRCGKLLEVYVQVRPEASEEAGEIGAQSESKPESEPENRLQEVLAPLSTPAIQTYFDTLGLDLTHYPDGYRTEVNLAAQDWLTTVSQKLQRGYCLTIDYGYSADRYYQPSRHQGTLQAYFQHSHHNNPYIHIGQQDLTAHVNFTALEQWGGALGLQKLGFTQQALMLMALGLGDRLTALATDATDITAIQTAIARREVLHQLMNPLGLGGFGVLAQGKGLTPDEQAQPLKGWSLPI